MDDLRFDGLARALGGTNSRRGALRLALGGLLGSLGIAVAGEETLAGKRETGGANDKGGNRKRRGRAAANTRADSPAAARGAGKGKGKGKGRQPVGAAGPFQALFCDSVAECNAAQPGLCFPPGADTSNPAESKCSCQGNRCKVTICHATSSASNPYTNPTVSFNAAGQLQGHEGHGDDLIPEPAGGCPEPCPSGVVCEGVCCPRGQHCSAGTCCPAGTDWNGRACIVAECASANDCHVDSECLVPVCDAGVCGSVPKPASVACGTACLPGACDGAGGCVQSAAADGTACGQGGICCAGSCAEGACCPGVDQTCPAGQVCRDGATCGCPSTCPAGQRQADDCSCSCPTACPSTQVQADDCTCGCTGGLTACGEACVDLSADPDNCGACGVLCPTGQTCQQGVCQEICVPDCTDRDCGDDGCGGSCGTCPTGQACAAGTCTSTCTPDCAGKTCGDDGCGGSCGTCPTGLVCAGGTCAATCTPDCTGKTCGDDGCGGSCGTCPTGAACTAAGTCTTIPTPPCIPFCPAGSCGSDQCGGTCACPGGQVCDTTTFTCAATCTPDCAGRTCGTDGCGGSCGTCPDGLICDETAGICQETPAICAPTGGDCTNVACCDAADTCLALDGAFTCQPTPPAPDRCAHAGERPTEGQRCCDRLHREGGRCVINRWDHCDPRKRGKASFCENGTRCVGGRLSPHRTTVCVPSKKRRGRGAESAMVTPAP